MSIQDIKDACSRMTECNGCPLYIGNCPSCYLRRSAEEWDVNFIEHIVSEWMCNDKDSLNMKG